MQITFWGAAQTTTGSLHLVQVNGSNVALDCGLFQGRRAEADRINREFPVSPRDIDAVVLSHAHIDHSGNLPTITRLGFRGDIHCTSATADLCQAMLIDSATIQEKDFEFVNKLRRKRGQPTSSYDPLYRIPDAEEALSRLRSAPMHTELEVAPGMRCQFLTAGHILGAAVVDCTLESGGRTHRLCFSGDVGRKKSTLMNPPQSPLGIETLIVESTYGVRRHEADQDLRSMLLDVVSRTVARGGKVIIPAFAVGRTQDIVFHLNALFNSGALGRVPIYVDSPLSTNVTEVFRRHPEAYNREAFEALQKDPDVFGFECLRYVRTTEESRSLNEQRPMVVISASGMCEAGRILHHLRNSVGDPRNTVLIVGYQAEHTLGRRLRDGSEIVRIFGEEHKVRAEIAVIDGFSAHADSEELKDWIFTVRDKSAGKLRQILFVHGEPESQAALVAWATDVLKVKAHAPARGEVVEL
jgi:metallo-beta-lactamase family protein